MAGKTFTLNNFRKAALSTEQITCLKGGNVDYLHHPTSMESVRVIWEGVDIRVNIPGEDNDVVRSLDLSGKFITLR